jgi:hypothetical protein
MKPESEARIGAVVKVCASDQVFAVVVPKAREKERLVERSPPPVMG